ncbi:SNF2_N-domain-containing protein, partial [Fragilariopsis cylindrus CCMP1102]
RGGILADSMGLGKTVQLLSMMQADKEDEDENETSYYGTLVVAPLSLLHQWEQEIETKTHLTHRIHYNDGKKKLCVRYDNIDVVLTTFGTLQAEFRTQQKQNETTGKLLSKMWKRVILDECHIIKNHQTLVAKACCSVRAERRWCVSGTIIQNSLHDLYSLIRFLRHEPFCEKAFWNNTITKVDFSVALDRVKKIICPIMIRRTKETLDRNGKPILILPEIDYKSVTVEFSPEERQFYEALYRKSFDIFKGFIQAGKASSSWLKIFSLLHRLRQSCSHVALTVKTNQDQENDKDSIDSSFLEDLHQTFKSMQSRSNTVNDDSNNEYVSSVAQMLNNAIQNESSELNEECPICLDVIDVATEPVLTPCLHMFCKGCLLDYTKNERQKKLSNTKTVNPICLNSGNCPVCSKEIDDRKILRMKYSSNARKTLQTAIKGSSSSKLAAIHKELQIIWEKEPGSKVLIFSQFLGFLDIIQKSFKTNNIRYSRLDGSLSLKDRMKVLRDFGCESPGSTSSLNSNAGSVLLISMKAGGVGLNLVAARSVFIVDPWWNSAVEDQCVDRIHRIGQTAEKIYVRKFFVSNSIEERILELQKRKKNIASAILCDK